MNAQLQRDLLAGVIFFAANFVSGVTGFGAAVFGLPLLALVLGLDVGKTSLMLLSTGLYAYIAIRWRAHIARKQLAIILLFTCIGMPLGMALYGMLPRRASLVFLGIFVLVCGILGLRNRKNVRPVAGVFAKALLIAGGVVHGAFTTGGPLIVVYANQKITDKSAFRAMLCAMWLALSVVLFTGWTLTKTWPAGTIHATLIGIPFTIAGIVAGEIVHQRLSAPTFHKLVSVTLVATGLLLVFS